jgi:hypothetical protein
MGQAYVAKSVPDTLTRPPATGQRPAPLCFASRGFSLPAATTVAADNRALIVPFSALVQQRTVFEHGLDTE